MAGLIILAAGQSGRMGEPKQNLVFNGITLLQHAINTAVGSQCWPIVTVLGANAESILSKTDISQTLVTINSNWQTGMASSIAEGLKQLKQVGDVTAAVIMLCDQPFVDSVLINKLMDTYAHSTKGIVACAYADTVGVPAIFDSRYFDHLTELKGDEGAKKLLGLYQSDVELIPFLKAGLDIDTADDYRKLVQG